MGTFWLIVGAIVALIIVFAVFARPLLNRLRQGEARRAIAQFRLQREQLELQFFEMARMLGKPRGLRWLDCDWLDRVTFGRDVESGLLTAFVAVNIRFEAIEGGDMEDVEAVGLLRDASALFHYRYGQWGTGGRALFNMNPEDALERLEGQYEGVEVSETRMTKPE